MCVVYVCFSDSATPGTIALQAPLSMEFSPRILGWVAISHSKFLPGGNSMFVSR